jgi:Translation machinery associated TMA7
VCIQEPNQLDGVLITTIDAKAKAELAAKASGKKGPLNTGSQGIKKSGKK